MFISQIICSTQARCFSLAVLISLFSVSTFAKEKSSTLADLIVPVKTSEAREIIKAMRNEIKESFHFSKRFRIVKINRSILDGSVDEFQITPFPGRSIEVKTDRIDTTYPARPVWVGHSIYGKKFAKEQNEETLKYALETMSAIRFISLEIPVATDNPGDSAIGFGSSEQSAIASSKTLVKVVTGTFFSQKYKAKFNIKPVPSNPEFYIVSEIDPKKMLSAHDDSDAAIERRNIYKHSKSTLKSNPGMYTVSNKWEKN